MESMLDRPFGMLRLEEGRGRRDNGGWREDGGRRRADRGTGQDLTPFEDFRFGNIFGNMNKMMQDMEKAFVSINSLAYNKI